MRNARCAQGTNLQFYCASAVRTALKAVFEEKGNLHGESQKCILVAYVDTNAWSLIQRVDGEGGYFTVLSHYTLFCHARGRL